MKTTLEIPDDLFRKAKSAAAQRGIPLRELVTDAIAEKLRTSTSDPRPWMKYFGGMKSLPKENAKINRIIEQEFGSIDPEEWQ